MSAPLSGFGGGCCSSYSFMAAEKQSSDFAASWDIEAFEQPALSGDSSGWNTNCGTSFFSLPPKKKKVTRIQDLAFEGLDTPPSSPRTITNRASEDTWPFESSPCRFFGANNTRNADDLSNQTKNEQLFNMKFGDGPDGGDLHRNFRDGEEEDEETSIEDDMNSEGLFMDDSDYDTDSFGEESMAGDDDSAFAPKQVASTSASKNDQAGSVRGKSASPRRSARANKSSGSGSKKDVGPVSKPERKESPQKKVEKQQQPPPDTSAAVMNKTERPRRTRNEKPRSKSNDDLMSATYHGNASMAVEAFSRPRVRRGVNRAKSSDGMDGLGGSVHTWSRKNRRGGGGGGTDELATSSMHARTSGARTKASSQRRASKPVGALDRRGKLSRAMSSTNVIRPEEYAGQQQHQPQQPQQVSRRSSSHSVSSRDGNEGLVKQKSIRQKSITEKSSTATVATTDTEETAYSSVDDSSTAGPKRPSMRRKRSSARLGRSGSSRSIEPKPTSHQPASTEPERALAPKGSVSPKIKASSVPPSPTAKRSSREKRDLSMLLRERKSIQPADLMDKENRKLLHFLMYEHKMGISQKEMHKRLHE